MVVVVAYRMGRVRDQTACEQPARNGVGRYRLSIRATCSSPPDSSTRCSQCGRSSGLCSRSFRRHVWRPYSRRLAVGVAVRHHVRMPRTHRRDARLAPAAFGLALALVLVSSRASSQPPADFGHLNPDAPPETSQFAFLVGQWDCAVHTMNPDGETFRDSTATWTGYYILDGWAIKDDWMTRRPDGTAFHGTNIRSFNPRTHTWDIR